MSLVCAIPRRGAVYFAADTQTTCGSYGACIEAGSLYKLQVIGNFVVGFVGSVSHIEIALSILNELKGRRLSRGLIINEYLPRFIDRCRNLGFITEKANESYRDIFPSFLIAEGGKLFMVNKSLVIRMRTPEAIGSGCTYVINSINQEMKEKDINDNLVIAIQKYGSKNIYVNKIVTLVNTKTLSLEVRE